MSVQSNMRKFVGTGRNAEGRTSKRVLQKHKARQIFRKLNISYPLIRTHAFLFSPYGFIVDEFFLPMALLLKCYRL